MGTASFSSKANPEQLKAIETTEGALLIIAGPGSGKTFTLVERIVYLITQKNVLPENLFVVTFTDKAAQELTTRISNRLLEIKVRFNLNEMYLGTFHSICLRWLDEYREFTRLKRNFTMMDQFDQHYFLYNRLAEYEAIADVGLLTGCHAQSSWDKSERLMKWINVVSEEALDPNILVNAPHPEIQALGQCYVLYQQNLEEANALDFSTIQLEALNLLKHNPAILSTLQAKIRYSLIDEYQDTNTIQEAILTLLVGDRPNLCVVGDDDQGLYRFRGATIRNILQFKDKFPDRACEQTYLTTNYRSHPDIIDFYNRWMKEQDWGHEGKVFRFEKQIESRKAEFPDVPCVVKVAGDSEEAWHREVLAFLHALRDRGQLNDWNQVAFLFRSVKNDKVVALSRFLEKQGINVYSPRSNQFFEREEIRLIIGAFIFLFPQYPKIRQWNENITLKIWNYYDEQCFQPFAEELRKPENADLLKWARTIAKRHLNLAENTDYAFSGLFYQLLRFLLFNRHLDESLLQQKGVHNSRTMRNLAIFSQLLSKFEYLHKIDVLTPGYLNRNLTSLFNQFIRFLEDGGIGEYEDESEYAPSGCVSFLTIHQSKGLEFPVVIVGSLGTSPTKQYSDLDEILEQYLNRPPFEPLEQVKFYDFRRLFYTAFSRAQNLLVLNCPEKKTKTGKWSTPSKHFADLYNSIPYWKDTRFKLEEIPLERVKEVNLKREYSFTSHLTVYEDCAEQYRFFKELEFAPVRTNQILFGTLVHQTIEDIHKTVLRGQEDRLSEEQVERWFETNYTLLTKRERVYLSLYPKRAALEQILRYYRRHEGNWQRVKEAEVDVSLVKDQYILTGSIDLIEGDNNTVEIVDFKSEKKPDVNNPNDRIKLDRYRRQLEVYAHIVEERMGLEVSKTHLYYTSEENGNPYISFLKNSRSIEKTVSTFDEVVKRIEAKDFSLAERPEKLCRDCDLRFYCNAKYWNFGEQKKL